MYPTTLCHELCKIYWTDWFSVWFVDLGWRKEAQVQSYSPNGTNVPTDASLDAEWGGSREHVLHWSLDVPKGRGTFMVSGRLKNVAKHGILGLGKRMSCAENRWTDVNDIYVVWRLLCKELCFLGVVMIAPTLNFLMALIFFKNCYYFLYVLMHLLTR